MVWAHEITSPRGSREIPETRGAREITGRQLSFARISGPMVCLVISRAKIGVAITTGTASAGTASSPNSAKFHSAGLAI
jgi:hypothetical protein